MEEEKSLCKECGNEYEKVHRKKFCSEECRKKSEKDRKKKYGKDNKEYFADKVKKYAHDNPVKIKAKDKAGRLIQIPENQLCQRCEVNKATQRHHEDYSKPLEVEFLCRGCHSVADVERRFREKVKRYEARFVLKGTECGCRCCDERRKAIVEIFGPKLTETAVNGGANSKGCGKIFDLCSKQDSAIGVMCGNKYIFEGKAEISLCDECANSEEE